MTGTKVWWASKTLWFNVVALVVGVAGYFVDTPIRGHGELTPVFAAIVACGNMGLRIFSTTQPLTTRRRPPPH